jgi:hypothetical protein
MAHETLASQTAVILVLVMIALSHRATADTTILAASLGQHAATNNFQSTTGSRITHIRVGNKRWAVSDLNATALEYLWNTSDLPNGLRLEPVVHIPQADRTNMCVLDYLQGFGQPCWEVRIGYDGKVRSLERSIAIEGVGPRIFRVSDSWVVRESLLGDWICVTNTFGPPDGVYAKVPRFQVYRPYCHPGDIGATNGPLEIAGALLWERNGKLEVLGETYYLHVTLPNSLFVGPLDGGVNFAFRRFRTLDGKEHLRLRRTKNPQALLEFELLRTNCPPPADLKMIFRTNQAVDMKEMDDEYEEQKAEMVRSEKLPLTNQPESKPRDFKVE